MFGGVRASHQDRRAALLPTVLVLVMVAGLCMACVVMYQAGQAYITSYTSALRCHRPESCMAALVVEGIIVATWATGVGAVLVLADLAMLLLALAYPPYFFMFPRGRLWHWGFLIASFGAVEMFSLPKFLG